MSQQNLPEPDTTALNVLFEHPSLSCRDRESLCEAMRDSRLCDLPFHKETCEQENVIKTHILSGNYTEMLHGLKLATPNIGIEWDRQRYTGHSGVKHTFLTLVLSDIRCGVKIQMVHELLRLGASANATASNGLSPMTAAIIGFGTQEHKYRSWIHAVVDSTSYQVGEDDDDNDDEDPSYEAASDNALREQHYKLKTDGLKILTQLLEAGADVNNGDATLMETPLIAAARRNSLVCAEFLLSKRAKPDGHYLRKGSAPDSEIKRGELFGTDRALIWDEGAFTPMRMAIINSDPRMVHMLLAWGANANTETERGLTPLHFAALALQFAAHEHYSYDESQKSVKVQMEIVAILIANKAVERDGGAGAAGARARVRDDRLSLTSRRIPPSDILRGKGDVHLAEFLLTLLDMESLVAEQYA